MRHQIGRLVRPLSFHQFGALRLIYLVVPLTLLAMTRDTEFGVVEMGASACGEIALLASGLILLFILLSSAGLYKLAKGEKIARRIALTDWLSHLPNRRGLIEHLDKLAAQGDTGAKTPFDIAPGLLSPKSAEQLRAEIL